MDKFGKHHYHNEYLQEVSTEGSAMSTYTVADVSAAIGHGRVAVASAPTLPAVGPAARPTVMGPGAGPRPAVMPA